MMSLWKNGGKLVKDAGGRLVLCDVCPCGGKHCIYTFLIYGAEISETSTPATAHYEFVVTLPQYGIYSYNTFDVQCAVDYSSGQDTRQPSAGETISGSVSLSGGTLRAVVDHTVPGPAGPSAEHPEYWYAWRAILTIYVEDMSQADLASITMEEDTEARIVTTERFDDPPTISDDGVSEPFCSNYVCEEFPIRQVHEPSQYSGTPYSVTLATVSKTFAYTTYLVIEGWADDYIEVVSSGGATLWIDPDTEPGAREYGGIMCEIPANTAFTVKLWDVAEYDIIFEGNLYVCGIRQEDATVPEEFE